MNPVAYLIAGLLVVLTIGVWVLVDALRHADDAFENELGFQFGLTPPVTSLDNLPGFIPTPAAPVVVPDPAIGKPRRPPGSKPPMLPANMTAADFATNAPWRFPIPTDPGSPPAPESQAPAPSQSTGDADIPPKQ